MRSGTYYLPSGYEGRPQPLLVLFRGLGKSGLVALDQNWVVRSLNPEVHRV